MSTIQEPPLQRDYTMELGGRTVVDPIWAKWLFDLAQYINSLNSATGASTGTGSLVRQTSPTLITPSIGAATGTSLTLTGGITTGVAAALHTTSVALNNGAGAALGTLANAPSAGNPTKWIAINDNGTIRYIPTWL